MDPEAWFYVVLLVFWFLSQLSSLAKKKEPRAKPRPASPPAAPEQQARGILESVSRLESQLAEGFSDLEPRAAALATAFVELDLRDQTRRTREALERALAQKDAGRLFEEIENGKDLLASSKSVAKTARVLSAARKTRETQAALRVADRMLDELYAPLSAFARTSLLLEAGVLPPLAVVLDPAADDPIRSSPLSRATLFVPRSVTMDPLHWALLAPELSRWIGGLSAGLYEEIFEGLSLNVGDADLANDREALSRVLFGAYLFRLVGDGVGACLFGPSYLRALGRLYAEPDQPSRVTTIYVNQDGTVHPEPPAHLRVHATAAWLAEMGFASEAAEATRLWDEAHGHPASFGIYRSTGAIPAAPVLDTATDLMAELHNLEIQNLAARTLATLPGLADGAPRRHEASEAKAAFLRGERAAGSARALVAGAMDAALEAPGKVTAIRNALYESVSPTPLAPREKKAMPSVPARRPDVAMRYSSDEIVEALILGEVLLAPRRLRF